MVPKNIMKPLGENNCLCKTNFFSSKNLITNISHISINLYAQNKKWTQLKEYIVILDFLIVSLTYYNKVISSKINNI